MKRPTALHWVGTMLPDGRPVRHLGNYGIPATDVDAKATAQLSDEQVALALSSGLYEAAKTPVKAETNSPKDNDN